MIPRAYRLSNHQEIRRVFRLGKKAYGSLFSFISLPNSLEKSRFAVIVSKKTAPRAVDRNRIKRFVREALRPNLPHITPGYDSIVVFLKKTPENPDLKAVSTDIDFLLHRIRLLS
ncbi:MAG: ribonuclease P protein component [Candidatus Moraniibacteriota bacterium]|nr:MAG: ribonuclease P protein component [Candidatus Moranbacteria bacterium]